MRSRFERVNMMLIIIGAFFCLIPFLDVLVRVNQHSTDDQAPFESSTCTRPAVLQAFFIVVIPAADIVLDLPRHIIQYFYPGEITLKKKIQKPFVFRLTDTERIVFILGVAIQAVAFYIPPQLSTTTSFFIKTSIRNCSTQLTLGPIILFLSRCTDTFTSYKSFVLILALVVGLMLYTVTYFFKDDRNTVLNLRSTANVLVILSFIIYISLTATCLGKYIMTKMGDPSARLSFVPYIFKLSSTPIKDPKDTYSCNNQRKDDDNGEFSDERYRNYIPALHMMCLMVMAIGKIYVKFIANNEVQATENVYIVSLTAEIMVLVIELRIRKNEVTRGLIALLASKKSYVRYISHELRTPLNTAFLGLKLLTSDMKVSTSPTDVDRYDTLCDVNMSCMAAVDILNDLLCYEKLESGILALHKQSVAVVPFLSDCVSMFSAQARECDVTMTVVTEVSAAESALGLSYSLQTHDAIFLDKFKMDQVIRNLISNALKFTPRGGALTVLATFVPDIYDKTESVSVNHNPSKIRKLCSDIVHGRKVFLKPKRISDISNTVNLSIVGKLVVVVTDTGAGISAENQKRLFKDIVQFSPEKLQAGGGSGLGLWITGGIVDLHGGKISVYSEGEGTGSSFTFELPMTRVNVQTESSQDNDDVRQGSIALNEKDGEDFQFVDLGGTTFDTLTPRSFVFHRALQQTADTYVAITLPGFDVLVVDDSRLNRKMLLKCLQSDKHVCTEGEDGLIAVMMVKKRMDLVARGIGRPYDAILMDFIMPNMDGPTATKAIRELGYTGPIFGVTGNGLPSDIAYFISCGADRVLLKPLNIEAFGQAMKEMGK